MALIFDNILMLGSSLLLCILFSIPKSHSLSLEMIRTDTITSFFPSTLTPQQKHQKYVNISRARVLHHRSQAIHLFNSSAQNTTRIGPSIIRPVMLSSASSLHVVSLKVGSLPYSTLWVLDSGSHFSWVLSTQCQNCFQILGGGFDHSTSNTFQTVPWNDQRCDQRLRIGDLCAFSITYIGCTTVGFVGTDTLSFQSNTGAAEDIPGIVFGNALSTPGVTFDEASGPNNLISGLFGIATGPNSFLEQTRDTTQMRFSYCLPPWNAVPSTRTYLSFGDDIPPPTQRQQQLTKTTPMRIERYYLNLLDMSLDGVPLHLDPAWLQLRQDGTGGAVLDTGAAHTSMVSSAYELVKAAFGLYFMARGVLPVEGPIDLPYYDLCYKWPILVHRLPFLTYHFENHADLMVAPENLFIKVQDNLACLTILPVDDQGPNLIGAMHQANYRFVHDLNTHRLSFYPEVCGF